MPVRNNAALADTAIVANSTIDGREAVGVSSLALERCRMPLVSEAQSEEKSSSGDLANACASAAAAHDHIGRCRLQALVRPHVVLP